jgi:hypothetical protein
MHKHFHSSVFRAVGPNLDNSGIVARSLVKLNA